jgi:gluconolactonase
MPRLALVVGILICPLAAGAEEPRRIDLRTKDGIDAVRGQWRYKDCEIVPIEFNGQDGQTKKSFDVVPHAEKPDFDDSAWEVIDPTTLGNPRGPGKLCFAWYRIQVTLPEGVAGKKVTFVTAVDDYGEVWVDGKLPYKVGQSGGAIVAGFNAPNRVELPDPKPGQTYSLAVFGINGPISVSPTNRIFLRETYLEIAAP